mgnify:CR=1 FL=1
MKFKKRINLMSLILIISLLLISTGVIAQEFPVTITDSLDNEFTLEEKPTKIISLSPNMTEVLFAVGAGENVVGVTNFADYPQEATEVEIIGSITEPNIEKIITMEPDVVIASSVNKMETIERLRELNVKVAGFSANSVDMAIENIKTVSKLTGNQEKGEEIVTEMYIKIGEMTNLVEDHLENNKKRKVFYEIWNDPLYTAGKNNFIDDLVNMAGGINIGRLAEGQWPQYNLEKLLIEDPEVYISTPHSADREVSKEKIKNRAQYQSISAIKNDRVYVIDQDILNRASPRLVKGLALMTKAIFPELTEEVNEIMN